MNAAHGDALRGLESDALLNEQIQIVRDEVAQLQPVAERARSALQNGTMDSLRYVNLRAGLLRKQIELVTLEATVREQRIALQTLLALPLTDTPARQ